MCGLAFVATKKKKNTGKRVYDLYSKQKARGQSGFGYIAIQDGKIVNLQRAMSEEQIKKTIFNETAEIILFHHRYPTSTPNTLGTAHPIFVSNDELEYDYLVMHNGVISNHAELYKKHKELGYVYNTEYQEQTFLKYPVSGEVEFYEYGDTKYNDSESLAIEIARFFEAKDSEINANGAAAVLGVALEKGTDTVVDVFYGQNYGRSLGRQDKKGWILIASEHGKEVEQMKFFHINPKTFKTVESLMVMDKGYQRTMGYGYSYSAYRDHRATERLIEPPKKIPQGKDNIYGLVNAVYTFKEAIDTGAPMSEFEFINSRLLDGRHVSCYVPKIFIGHPEDRPLFSDAYYFEQIEEPAPDKDQERLETLAMEYARREYEKEHLSTLYDADQIDHDTYKSREAKLDIKLTQLEEEMSSLGIDMEIVEDTVQTAQEFVLYEYSERG